MHTFKMGEKNVAKKMEMEALFACATLHVS
jgi:hypothetical protein